MNRRRAGLNNLGNEEEETGEEWPATATEDEAWWLGAAFNLNFDHNNNTPITTHNKYDILTDHDFDDELELVSFSSLKNPWAASSSGRT